MKKYFKKSYFGLVLVFTMLLVMVLPTMVFADSSDEGAGDGDEPTAMESSTSWEPASINIEGGVDATVYWEREYEWTIEKSVDPDYLEMYVGESGEVTYTIQLTKDEGTDNAWIEGNVSVYNTGEYPTQGLYVIVYLRAKETDVSGPLMVVDSVYDEPVINGEVGPLQTVILPYKLNLPLMYLSGYTLGVQAQATIDNHPAKGHVYEKQEVKENLDPITVPTEPTLINDKVNVDDTNGMTWEFDKSGFVTYKKTFICYEDATHINTATIRETGQSDDATVTLICKPMEGERFTIGFWKNHSGLGSGNQEDLISQHLPISLGSLEVKTVEQAVAILSNMGSNGISKLMAQLLAAKLNQANFADTSSINATIAAADDFLSKFDESDWTSLTKKEQKPVLTWMDQLDKFNNGM